MNDKIEIGDIIMYKELPSWHINSECYYAFRRYVVIDVSKSGRSVYYDDNRTNIKCGCNRCKGIKYTKENLKTSKIMVQVDNIRLVEKWMVIDRDNKLKQLGI